MLNKELKKINDVTGFSKAQDYVKEYKKKYPNKDIVSLGIGDVSIVDGTTQKVSVSSEVTVKLLEVDESSYKYYTKAEGGDWEEWTITDPDMQAKLVNGSVEWDISKLGVLENGTTYRVSFDVYPSQFTNDLIADLENGEVEYSELEASTGPYAGLADYIKPSNGDYTLETNTTAVLNYTDTRVSNEEQSIGFINPNPFISISLPSKCIPNMV